MLWFGFDQHHQTLVLKIFISIKSRNAVTDGRNISVTTDTKTYRSPLLLQAPSSSFIAQIKSGNVKNIDMALLYLNFKKTMPATRIILMLGLLLINFFCIAQKKLQLEVLGITQALIDEHTPGMEQVKYGNEGGEVVKDDKGMYHWFTSEQFGDPYWVANAITHWISKDGIQWKKDTTWKKEGNHDYTSSRDKSSYFDPTVKYDEQTGYWYMFYVAYRNAPDNHKNPGNNRGKIYRSKAMIKGIAGLSGPYHDNDKDDVVIIEPLDNPPPYESKWIGNKKFGYGCHTVTPYKIGDVWYMVWGENMIARGTTSLTGKFKRIPEGDVNPITYQRELMEFIPDYSTASHHKFYLKPYHLQNTRRRNRWWQLHHDCWYVH